MLKIIICALFSTLMLTVDAKRLFGNDLKEAEKVLNQALDTLIHENGPIYSQHGLDAAYIFIPNVVYTFNAILQDWRNDYKRCQVSISYTNTDQNVLVTIKCEGDPETVRRIVNEVIFVKPTATY